ncbi:hypothetical protein [Bradyrhizobium guangdongense]|uniref:hypothetical protein n=1 Tax=Bradyrhizobium guangdongense TaxID=1325090 RepID=UPI0032DEF925
MAEETKGRGRPFDEPIRLDDGRVLRTFRDAGEYIATLPETAHDAPEWQAAMEALLLVAERGRGRSCSRGWGSCGR